MLNRDRFFPAARAGAFGGRLTQQQVDGLNVILDAWERRSNPDLRHLAYMLATTKWETAHTMAPINERGGDAYFFRMYDRNGERPEVARALGNIAAGDGARFHGRGYVQLTGRTNYHHMSKVVGVDLVENPDLALDPDVAAVILMEGMERGMFTGVGLGRYFNAITCDWVNARRIINGTDCAEQIAEIARGFNIALDGAR